jgi:hypothetical protein
MIVASTSDTWIEPTSLALAVAALIFATVHWRQASAHQRDLEEQGKRLGSVADQLTFVTESLSTRYVGPFPEYFSEVIALMEDAYETITILVGNPLPAYFTNPRVFDDYSDVIARKRQGGVKVQMICMAEAQRRRRLALQFAAKDATEWASWKRANAEQLDTFLDTRFRDTDATSLDRGAFLDLLARNQRELIAEKFERVGVDVVEVDAFVPVQVWLADEKVVMFAIQNSAPATMSHGLFTSDHTFVAALIAMVAYYA